ncbi:hypothetical protein DESC_610091 [Desulfosarcina cetonica]|nr:hypothetical protein DESC_610091 [Desulfosarcina cetonica]
MSTSAMSRMSTMVSKMSFSSSTAKIRFPAKIPFPERWLDSAVMFFSFVWLLLGSSPLATARPRSLACHGHGIQGQHQLEPGTTARPGRNGNVAAHAAGQDPRPGQSQAVAATGRQGIGVDARVAIENQLAVRRGNAGPIVGHRQAEPLILAAQADIDPLPAVLQGIFDQIAHDLPEFVLIQFQFQAAVVVGTVDGDTEAIKGGGGENRLTGLGERFP